MYISNFPYGFGITITIMVAKVTISTPTKYSIVLTNKLSKNHNINLSHFCRLEHSKKELQIDIFASQIDETPEDTSGVSDSSLTFNLYETGSWFKLSTYYCTQCKATQWYGFCKSGLVKTWRPETTHRFTLCEWQDAWTVTCEPRSDEVLRAFSGSDCLLMKRRDVGEIQCCLKTPCVCVCAHTFVSL